MLIKYTTKVTFVHAYLGYNMSTTAHTHTTYHVAYNTHTHHSDNNSTHTTHVEHTYRHGRLVETNRRGYQVQREQDIV